jgi:hypothetical protein
MVEPQKPRSSRQLSHIRSHTMARRKCLHDSAVGLVISGINKRRFFDRGACTHLVSMLTKW